MRFVWRSRLVVGVMGFTVGLAVGIGGTVWFMQWGLKTAKEFAVLHHITSEYEDAMQQYMFSNPSAGMYALDHYIRTVEFYKEQKLESLNKALSFDLAIAYARLGNLAEKAGQRETAAQAFSKALMFFQQTDQKITSVVELKRTIQHFDESYQKGLRKQQGAIKE